MTRVKTTNQEGGASLNTMQMLEDALDALNLRLDQVTNPPSAPKVSPKPKKAKKAKKATKELVYTPGESPEPETKPRQNVRDVFIGYFGEVSRLESWQRLCMDLKVPERDLSSLKKCRAALSRVNVNIIDVIEAQTARAEARSMAASEDEGGVKIESQDQQHQGLDVKKFNTRFQLLRYTRRHKKFFPKQAAKELGPIRCLLKSMK